MSEYRIGIEVDVLLMHPAREGWPVNEYARRAFDMMKRDGTLEQFFWGVPAVECLNRDWVAAWLKWPNLVTETAMIFFMGDFVGFFTVSQEGEGVGRVNHCFFREVWGRAHRIAEPIIERLLTRFPVLRGATPETNRAGIKFIGRCGFTVLGTVPGGAWLAHEGRRVGLVESYRLAEGV